MRTREVWVTGAGCVTGAGPDADSLLRLLTTGRSAIGSGPARNGARVVRSPRRRADRRLGRAASMFVSAAEEAWSNAGLPADGVTTPRGAVIEGSSLGPGPEMLAAAIQRKKRPDARSRRPRPSDVVRFMCGSGGSAFAQTHRLEGGAAYLSAGSVSSALAILEGARQVSTGALDIAVAGGAEAPFQEDVEAALHAAGVLAPSDAACRPFTVGRVGTQLGEGSAALILEAADRASKRGVSPLAVLDGWGQASEFYSMVAPETEGSGVRRATLDSLRDSISADLGSIKLHGTGTQRGDAAEARGLSEAIGSELSCIPASGLKSALGHCLGASGAIEAVAMILALKEGFVPATVGWTGADPELPEMLLSDQIQAPVGPKALLLSESFGGKTVALTFSVEGA